jgi:hypothetical protein
MSSRYPGMRPRWFVAALAATVMVFPNAPAVRAETSLHKLEKRLRKVEKTSGAAAAKATQGFFRGSQRAAEGALAVGAVLAAVVYEWLQDTNSDELLYSPHKDHPNSK